MVRDASLDGIPIQLGSLTHGDPAHEEPWEESIGQIMQGDANVISNGPVVSFRSGDVLSLGSINERAIQIVLGRGH
jgi:hypothetical protein